MLTTPFEKMKLVTHVVNMHQILFFVQQLMMNVNLLIGNVSYGILLPVLLFLYREMKKIHQTEHQ